MGPVRPTPLLSDYLIEEGQRKVESQQKENNLDENEAIVKVKEWRRWTQFQVLTVGVIANNHHARDNAGYEEIEPIPETILVTKSLDQKDEEERGRQN